MNKLVIVAIEEKYSDNSGAYDVAVSWDGETVDYEIYGGNNAHQTTPVVNATLEQIKAAGEYIATTDLKGDLKVGQQYTVIRARGIKKGTVVTVADYYDTYWNGQVSGTKVEVITPDGENKTIGVNCLDSMVRNVPPYWAE